MHQKVIALLVLLLNIIPPAINPPFQSIKNCESPDFASILGSTDQNENGGSLVPIPGSTDFILGGSQENNIVLLRISEFGEILQQSAFSFSQRPCTLLDLKFDSDGFLIGAGNEDAGGSNQSGYAFRYDLANDLVAWVSQALPTQWAYSILETAPGSDFMYIGAHGIMPPSPGTGDDVAWRTLDRNTGNATNAIDRNYHFGGPESFYFSLPSGPFIYHIGRYSFSPNPATFRASISKFDLSGNEIWSRLFHVPNNNSARLYGRHAIELNNTIYVTYYGDDDGTSLTQTNFFIANLDSDGNVNWLRKYDVSEMNNEQIDAMIPTPEGILLVGQQISGERDLFVSKIDFDGNILWASRYRTDNTESINNRSKNVAHLRGDQLFVTASVNTGSGSDILLLRSEREGEDGPECAEIQNLSIDVIDLPTDNILSISLTEYIGSLQFHSPAVQPEATDLPSVSICPIECTEVCDNGLDDDGDGFIDCDDPDLAGDCCCYTPPILELGPDLGICTDEIITLDGTPGFNEYLWSDGSISSEIQIITPGEYWLAATDSCGIVHRDTVAVVSSNFSEVMLSQILCGGDTVEIFGNSVTEPGIYTQTFEREDLCDSVVVVEVSIEDLTPEVIVMADSQNDDRSVATVRVDNPENHQYQWSFSTENAPIVQNVPPGEHFLTLTSELGCLYTVSFNIEPNNRDPETPLQPAYFAPTAFSPNGDGRNDFFFIRTNGEVVSIRKLMIFDRWGELVWEGKDLVPNQPDLGWNGDFGGQPMNSAVFVYIVQLELGNGNILVHSGDFVLVR